MRVCFNSILMYESNHTDSMQKRRVNGTRSYSSTETFSALRRLPNYSNLKDVSRMLTNTNWPLMQAEGNLGLGPKFQTKERSCSLLSKSNSVPQILAWNEKSYFAPDGRLLQHTTKLSPGVHPAVAHTQGLGKSSSMPSPLAGLVWPGMIQQPQAAIAGTLHQFSLLLSHV